MSAPFRFPKFFVTNPSPCPYLPGKVERKVFTELNGRNAGELNEALGRIGFRRCQSVAYRPSCVDCSACVSVRVLAERVHRQRNPAQDPPPPRRPRGQRLPAMDHRRAICTAPPLSRRAPPGRRHGRDGRAGLSPTWSSRRRSAPMSSNIASRRSTAGPGKLVGACLSDQQGDGLSMIYSFFDVGPGARKGLGTYIILDHIVRAARAGLPYVYLGYWVEGSDRMAYKASFRPTGAARPRRLAADGRAEPEPIALDRRTTRTQPTANTDRRLIPFPALRAERTTGGAVGCRRCSGPRNDETKQNGGALSRPAVPHSPGCH